MRATLFIKELSLVLYNRMKNLFEIIRDYGFSGSIGIITTNKNTHYLDWRCLQNIVDDMGDIRGEEIEVVDGQILFNSLTGIN